MSNKISRRSFLKVSGASALALGAASMLGGCQSSSSNSVEVKVGDKISNWNNLAVQLTSVFTLADAPDVPGSKYVAILVTAVNRSKTDTMAIGAQNVLEIDAAYPLNTEELKAANTAPYFHALSASTTDFAEQTASLALLLKYACEHLIDGKRTLPEIITYLDTQLKRQGLSFFSEGSYIPCGYAMPRIQEIYSCFNRYRRP